LKGKEIPFSKKWNFCGRAMSNTRLMTTGLFSWKYALPKIPPQTVSCVAAITSGK